MANNKKTVPVQAGNCYTVKVTGLGSSAEGVARYRDFTLFIAGALPGEEVETCIFEVKKNYARGTLKKICKASPARIAPRCPIYEACGGCQLQQLDYREQLKVKRQQVLDALAHIGGQQDIVVHETLGADDPWNYRNKMQFPIGKEKGHAIIGCFAQGTHDIIDTHDCCIQKQMNNDIVNAVREAIEKLNISVYDENRHAGALRYVVGRVGRNGEAMLILVTAVQELRKAKELVLFLRKKLPKLVSVHQNIQTYRNNVVMGRDTKLLWGRPTIVDSIGKLDFHISPRSFFQVNTAQAEKLYAKALEYAQLTGRETVIDAYCGTGTITLFLARRAHRVYGIEIVKPAIRDAEKNARDNHIKNAEFIVGDTMAVMPRLYHQGVRPNVVVVDPPRAGCAPEVLETFARMQPQRIVYVSCNPASLARDIAILNELGYKALEIQPVDMFSQTSHVECVALMSRVQK